MQVSGYRVLVRGRNYDWNIGEYNSPVSVLADMGEPPREVGPSAVPYMTDLEFYQESRKLFAKFFREARRLGWKFARA